MSEGRRENVDYTRLYTWTIMNIYPIPLFVHSARYWKGNQPHRASSAFTLRSCSDYNHVWLDCLMDADKMAFSYHSHIILALSGSPAASQCGSISVLRTCMHTFYQLVWRFVWKCVCSRAVQRSGCVATEPELNYNSWGLVCNWRTDFLSENLMRRTLMSVAEYKVTAIRLA